LFKFSIVQCTHFIHAQRAAMDLMIIMICRFLANMYLYYFSICICVCICICVFVDSTFAQCGCLFIARNFFDCVFVCRDVVRNKLKFMPCIYYQQEFPSS